ncbi:hypothetical protein NC651_038540 [Populus alba x Populus x berolinensis]|nr:hypothetical protein NC651_038540 [Populus alba x Populus x berolinensis]
MARLVTLRRALLVPEGLRRVVLGTYSQTRNFATKGKRKSKSDGSESGEENTSKKDLALQQALDQITSQFGKGSIMWFGRSEAPKNVPVVSTGSFALDIALGCGGFPKGRVVEIFGPEASGKTTLALHVIAEAQKQGGYCIFMDAEHALDSSLAKAIGVNTENLLLSQPDCGEQALSLVDTLIRSGSVDVVVVDSVSKVAALVPKSELDGEMGDAHMAMQARLMSQALRKLSHSLSQSQTVLIFINQVRAKLSTFGFGGPTEVTCGGNALKFYASVRLNIRRVGFIKKGEEEFAWDGDSVLEWLGRSYPTSPVQVQLRCCFLLGQIFPFPAAALSTIEPSPTRDCNPTNPQNSPAHLPEANTKISRKFWSPNLPNLNDKSESNVTSSPVRFDAKERLKRYSVMLRECASKGDVKEGKAIHGNLITSGVELDSHLWVSLINFYAKCRSRLFARKVLAEMPQRDVVSWTALISGFVNEGCGSEGVSLYCEMRKENVRANEFALATALKACSMCLNLEFGKQVHVEAIKAGLLLDLFVGSALVDLYARCGEMELAERLFFGMPEKNGVSWNALLNGYAQLGDGKKVLKLFCKMKECETKFSKFTLSTVLKGCANTGSLREGKVLHALALRSGCEIDEFLGCSLVDMYSKCGTVYDALKVFTKIRNPDVVAWSAMITALISKAMAKKRLSYFI